MAWFWAGRIQGASGELQAKGTWTYPCALRLWYNLQTGEQNLLVKVNARIKAQLGKWKAKKKASYGNARLGTVTNDKKPQMKKQKRSDNQRGFWSFNTLQWTQCPLTKIWLTPGRRRKGEDSFHILLVLHWSIIYLPLRRKGDIIPIIMEEHKRDLISWESSIFRETHTRNWEKGNKEMEKDRQEIETEKKQTRCKWEQERWEWEWERERVWTKEGMGSGRQWGRHRDCD